MSIRARNMDRGRRGMGLVEVVIAMAIAVAMVGLLAATVSRMLRANAESSAHRQTLASLGRLGEQFRRDVREATAANVTTVAGNETGQLVLTGANDRQITYSVTGAGIERVCTAPQEPRRHELFTLDGMKPLGWQVDADSRQVSLALGPLVRWEMPSGAVRGRFSLLAFLAPPRLAAERAAEPKPQAAAPRRGPGTGGES